MQPGLLNDHYCIISHLLLTTDPLMKQMPFPDTNYGKQNKQKQTLKPIIIRPLMQTRCREVVAYQILEVIRKHQSVSHPLGFFVSVLAWSKSPPLFYTGDTRNRDLIFKKKIFKGEKKKHLCVFGASLCCSVLINDIPPCSLSLSHSSWAVSTWLIFSTCSLWMFPARNRSMQINSLRGH